MKINHLVYVLLAAALALGAAGCAKKPDAREKHRIEAEQQDAREAAKANAAISRMNQRAFGRKPPGMDLGLPPEKPAESAPEPSPQP